VTTIAEFRGSFRAVVNDGARLRQGSKGTWYCRCGALAETVPKMLERLKAIPRDAERLAQERAALAAEHAERVRRKEGKTVA